MKIKMVLFVLLLALASVSAQSTDQQDEIGTRGAFLTTRPKQVDKPAGSASTARVSRRRPKTVETKTSVGTETTVNTKNTATTSATVTTTEKPINRVSGKAGQRMGLGLTLFTRDSNGLAVRVDPNRVFRRGDRVRVLLETNADGYLYIFNTTDGGKPVMIYPDARLDDAGNYIRSHVPFEIPSSLADQEPLRWFSFDEQGGAERLFFVFTREPLPRVPIDDDLQSYCGKSHNKCPWQPAPEVWAHLQKEMTAPIQVDKSKQFGNAQSSVEQQASTRGIGLSKDDPEPSLIMLTASSNTPVLVATLDLVHR